MLHIQSYSINFIRLVPLLATTMKLFGLGYNQHGQIDADHCLNIILKPSQYLFSQSNCGIFTSLDSVVGYNGSHLTIQGFCCGQPKVKACIRYDAEEPVEEKQYK